MENREEWSKENLAGVSVPAWRTETGMGEMTEHWNHALCFLQFPAFLRWPFLRHGFSTRTGGASKGCFSSMNFSFDKGDDPACVRENYRRMAEAIGVSLESFVVARQTHTTNIRMVTEADRGAGVMKERPYRDVDGLMTNVPGITLVTFHADCIPIYIADPVRHAVALLHAGWKGTVSGIAGRAVRMMREAYESDPGDLLVGIGPGISSRCYEVGEDVAACVREAFEEADCRELLICPHTDRNGILRWQLDLKRANQKILLHSGVQQQAIHISELCTRENSHRIFSHRAAGAKRGVNAAFLGLVQETTDPKYS